LVIVAAMVAACGGGGGSDGGEPPRIVTSVTITSPSESLNEGDTLQLAAVARDQSGAIIAGITPTWSVSDASIAIISQTGFLQTLKAGAEVVTAQVDGVSGTLALTIAPAPVRLPSSVTIISPTLSPKEGDTLQLAAVVRDQFGDIIPGATPVWSSSDSEIAAVDAAGLLRTFATGTVVVTAKADGRSGVQSFSITPLVVSVTFGAKEVVFDYTTDRCDNLDLPDQPARFVRSEDGSLVLVDGNAPRHHLSRGADFGSLKRDCNQPALLSADRTTPDSYANWEWLWVVYREGPRWHALTHNEFHDPVAGTCHPGDSSPSNPCWYNSITYAVSTDGARSFSKPSAPGNVVAPAPYAWAPPAQQATYFYAEGYMGPTNIVHANDGYYYSLFSVWRILQLTTAKGGICVMRTDTLEDPARWRAWDGSGFKLRMTSPYVTGSPAPVCRFLKTPMASGHLVYSTYLNR
jgi:hypothetical protein